MEEAHAEDSLCIVSMPAIYFEEEWSLTLTKVPGRKTMPSVLIAFIAWASRCAASAMVLATALSCRALTWKACALFQLQSLRRVSLRQSPVNDSPG